AGRGDGERLGDRRGDPIAELLVDLAELVEPLQPLAGVAPQRLAELGRRDVEPGDIDGAGRRDPADRRLLDPPGAANALDHPLEHAHVLAVARPQEATLGVTAEPPRTATTRRRPLTRSESETAADE